MGANLAKIAAFAAAVLIGSTASGLAKVHHLPRSRGASHWACPCAAQPRPDWVASRFVEGAAAVPDFRVQYGYVAGPASGSLGAMLEGRNPAAGAIP